MKKAALLLWALLAFCAVSAQNKTFTLEESVLKQGSTFAPKNLPGLHWISGTDNYAWIERRDGGNDALMSAPAAKGDAVELVTKSALNEAMKKAGLEELKGFPGPQPLSATSFRFWQGNRILSYDWSKKEVAKLIEFPETAENQEWHSSGAAGYTVGNNLYLYSPAKGHVQVTHDTKPGIVNGKSVHRDEFGIHNGIFWSPDANQCAFYHMDESMVSEYNIYDLGQKPAGATSIRYPMAGDTSHQVQVGVYNLATGKTIWLQTGTPDDHYLTNITWDPTNKFIFIAELNRDQNHLKLNQYDAADGHFIKTLFEEKDEKYVQPLNGLFFIPGKGGEFLWLSQRDGFNHAYHYAADGKLLAQLTKGEWVITAIHGFSPDGATLYYQSTQESPIERHSYAYDFKTKATRRLTAVKGTHMVTLSDSRKYMIDHVQSTTVPRLIQIVDAKGAAVRQVFAAEDPLKDYALGNIRLFTIDAEDGTDLWCRMFLPVGFDPNKQYPVLVYVYNGPNVQLIADGYQAASPLWMQWMAQQGWIVFTVDGRGSANRGKAFEQATFRDLGTVEVKDQLKGIEWLTTQSYVDKSRLAVHGWSYGGFMTTSLMLRAPGIFDVGVAGGPVIDWSMYEVMYTERYMDTPQTNPEGYKKSLTTEYVKSLQGKLMLIHGTSDDVVLWQHSLAFLEAAVGAGVQVDYFVYPGHPHNVIGPDRAHLMRKVLDYIMANTK
jgi:dipeptidyl-peptidase-4